MVQLMLQIEEQVVEQNVRKPLTAEEMRDIRRSRRSKNKKSLGKSTDISRSKSKANIDYCPHYKKPCCRRKTSYCKMTTGECTTDGITKCDLVKE
jgi:hypothetical protein